LERLEQLTQVKAILQQKLAAAVRQLVAALEWFEQLTQVMATLKKLTRKSGAAARSSIGAARAADPGDGHTATEASTSGAAKAFFSMIARTRQVADFVNGIFCAARSTASPSITKKFCRTSNNVATRNHPKPSGGSGHQRRR